MRRLAVLVALLPLAASAQPDPYAPTPLVPGTFELTVYDGGERAVEGTAVFAVHPPALGGGWTLLLDDGTDLFAFERASAPGLAGAAFGDARTSHAPGDVLAYVRFDDASAGAFSTGAAPPASPDRLAIAETDAQHTLGAFDFAAVRIMPDGTEGRLRIAGRFHALDEPDGGNGDGDGGDGDGGFPPLGAGRDCPAVWDWAGGLYGGAGSWAGFLDRVDVGGPATLTDGQMVGTPGWQLQLTNGCNQTLPGAYISTFGHTASALHVGIYRITNGLEGQPPGPFEVTAGMGQMYGLPYVYVSGYLWITHVGADRITGTYSGYAAPVPIPDRPPGPTLFTYGRFSARPSGPTRVELPPGVELPLGVELPPGIEVHGGDD